MEQLLNIKKRSWLMVDNNSLTINILHYIIALVQLLFLDYLNVWHHIIINLTFVSLSLSLLPAILHHHHYAPSDGCSLLCPWLCPTHPVVLAF